MSNSSDSEPFQDSGSEYVPNTDEDDDDDSLSSISDCSSGEPVMMGDFTAVADPFSVLFFELLFEQYAKIFLVYRTQDSLVFFPLHAIFKGFILL